MKIYEKYRRKTGDRNFIIENLFSIGYSVRTSPSCKDCRESHVFLEELQSLLEPDTLKLGINLDGNGIDGCCLDILLFTKKYLSTKNLRLQSSLSENQFKMLILSVVLESIEWGYEQL